MAISPEQWTVLAIVPKFTGSLSLFCSSLIVCSILSDPKKRATIYHRLILGISFVDLSNSFWFGMSTWPIQRGEATFAVGTDASCVMQGWFVQMGIAMCFYNTSLALYYTLVLRYGWSEERVCQLEPFMHVIPLLWGIGTATISIPLRLMNNANLWCWIAPYPSGCSGETCIRGNNADYYRWGFYYGPLWLNIIGITTTMVMVFLHVRKASKEKASVPEDTNATSALLDSDADGSGDKQADDKDKDKATTKEAVSDSKRASKEKKEKSVHRYVLIQCFLYSGAFYLNWIWLTAVRFMQAAKYPVPFGLLVIAAAMAPFQGFPNLLVYVFPRFLSSKEENPGANFVRWFKDSLFS